MLSNKYVTNSLLFRKEHLAVPLNQGEKRESLIILEKMALYDGLLKSLSTESLVSHPLLNLSCTIHI